VTGFGKSVDAINVFSTQEIRDGIVLSLKTRGLVHPPGARLLPSSRAWTEASENLTNEQLDESKNEHASGKKSQSSAVYEPRIYGGIWGNTRAQLFQ
jgi:hypothetical protein